MDTKQGKKKFVIKREYNMLLVLIGMLIVCAIISPTFRTAKKYHQPVQT